MAPGRRVEILIAGEGEGTGWRDDGLSAWRKASAETGADDAPAPKRALMLYSVLGMSLLTVIYAFLPRALFNFALSEEACWRVCCALLGVSTLLSLARLIQTHRALLRRGRVARAHRSS